MSLPQQAFAGKRDQKGRFPWTGQKEQVAYKPWPKNGDEPPSPGKDSEDSAARLDVWRVQPWWIPDSPLKSSSLFGSQPETITVWDPPKVSPKNDPNPFCHDPQPPPPKQKHW